VSRQRPRKKAWVSRKTQEHGEDNDNISGRLLSKTDHNSFFCAVSPRCEKSILK
jgi:hypothetical protein